MPARKRPCAECPWSRLTAPGQFPAERYEALRNTTGEIDGPTLPLGSPMFACHKSSEGKEIACAGWLVALGAATNLTARVNIAQGSMEMPVPDESWPPLFDTYDEMAETQSG